MAVPVVTAKQGVAGPADAKVPTDTDSPQGLRVTITLYGTGANTLTDFATLAAQNFACPSATMLWERAG
jgi:hypothetical protein